MKTGNDLKEEIELIQDQQELLNKLVGDKRKKLTEKDKTVAQMLLLNNGKKLEVVEKELEVFMNGETKSYKQQQEVV